MNTKKSSGILFKLFLFLFLAALLPALLSTAHAAPGDGNGSSGGKNKNLPLTLRRSVPSDEARQVPLDVTIELYFSKNICNIKVLKHNQSCFHLTREDGTVIPIQVTVPDDQVQRTYKRDAFLKPKQNLSPHTRYRVAVDRTLKAKNGHYIDNAHVFEFVTGDTTGASKPKELIRLGQLQIQTFDAARPENKNSVPRSRDHLLDKEATGIPTRSIVIPAVVIIAAILTSATFIGIRRHHRSHSDNDPSDPDQGASS